MYSQIDSPVFWIGVFPGTPVYFCDFFLMCAKSARRNPVFPWCDCAVYLYSSWRTYEEEDTCISYKEEDTCLRGILILVHIKTCTNRNSQYLRVCVCVCMCVCVYVAGPYVFLAQRERDTHTHTHIHTHTHTHTQVKHAEGASIVDLVPRGIWLLNVLLMCC